MLERFKALDGLRGLNSLLAFNRESGSITYASESLDPSLCNRVSVVLREAVTKFPEDVSLINVNCYTYRILVYALRDHFLVLSVDHRFDVKELRERLKSASTRERERAVISGFKLTELEKTPLNVDHIDDLVGILQTISSQAIDELNLFVVANALKNVRSELEEEHPVLASFDVAKDGKVVLTNAPVESVADASRGFAHWIRRFYDRCNDIVPTFPPELAISLIEYKRKDLNELGFYEAWYEAGVNR